MRDDSGTDHATGLDGDFQSTVPPQAEADVVGEVFVAVARVEHFARSTSGTKREQQQTKARPAGGPDLPAIACKRLGRRPSDASDG